MGVLQGDCGRVVLPVCVYPYRQRR